MKGIFISPTAVAMKQNPSFPQDLSPYIYTLNDGFGAKYKTLLARCGMVEEVTHRQIASVLDTMSSAETSVMTTDKAWHTAMSILNSSEQEVCRIDGVKL